MPKDNTKGRNIQTYPSGCSSPSAVAEGGRIANKTKTHLAEVRRNFGYGTPKGKNFHEVESGAKETPAGNNGTS